MIYIGADHGGYELKGKIAGWLAEWGYQFEDLGAPTNDPTDDYPQYAFAVAEAVATQPKEHKGIVGCRSAAGVIVAANKVKGIRAVAAFDENSARHSREHNNANVLGLSGDWLNDNSAKSVLKAWLEQEFTGEERHQRRIEQIEQYEESHSSE